jgi:hypothetical protein
LDILNTRKLTDDEKDLLARLSKGESLPEPSMKKHKTGGGYMFDDKGKVILEDEPADTGKEFLTSRGKQKKIQPKKNDVIDARVYRNRNSEERFFFLYVTTEKENGSESTWVIFRTGSERYPLGQIMDIRSPKFADFINKHPEQLWKELDFDFDYGMILDDELYEDVVEYVELYKDNQVRYKNRLIELKNKFLKLL